MESLLASRKISQEPARLENLSPQKYGKAAFSALTFTPSKLVDNVLYKEFSNQKRLEEGSSKLRETEASNSILQDRLSELQEEKQGIQKTLGDQINMYKKILKQKEEKNEKRIKSIQQGFNAEIARLINEKQQEAKYAQAQKQLLESRIAELEAIEQQLRNQLNNLGGNHDSLVNQNEKLKLIQDSLTKRLDDAQNAYRKLEEKSKQDIQQLKRMLQQTNDEWQKRNQKQIQAKNRQIENLERLHRNELQKIQNKRVQQALLKNQELKDLAATFQKQTNRLNGIINKKQDQINQLNKSIEAEKQKAFTMSKGYENQITSLSHQKARLKEQLIKADMKVEKLTAENQELQDKLAAEASGSQAQIAQLRKDLELNQINLMRQIDKNDFSIEQLSKEVARLRIDNEQLAPLAQENVQLHRELRNMKQLLIESSVEMERCKEQFIRIGRQKDLLTVKLKELGMENQTLYRIKNERQQQARGWRESYYAQKTRY